jgi:hypothetical protein
MIAILMTIGDIIILFPGITPLIISPLTSINISDYEFSQLGLLITIGGLILVVLGIASFIVFMGFLLEGKRWARTITLIISIIAIIIAIISLVSSEYLIHIIEIIVYDIIIYYMFTKNVKLFFGKVNESTTT